MARPVFARKSKLIKYKIARKSKFTRSEFARKIQPHKGIQQLNLDHLNHINILTGNNNSGKTTILELLSTIDSPQNLGSWINASRINNIAYEGIFFDSLYNLFPVDSELEHPIGYCYTDNKGLRHEVLLQGELEGG